MCCGCWCFSFRVSVKLCGLAKHKTFPNALLLNFLHNFYLICSICFAFKQEREREKGKDNCSSSKSIFKWLSKYSSRFNQWKCRHKRLTNDWREHSQGGRALMMIHSSDRIIKSERNSSSPSPSPLSHHPLCLLPLPAHFSTQSKSIQNELLIIFSLARKQFLKGCSLSWPLEGVENAAWALGMTVC